MVNYIYTCILDPIVTNECSFFFYFLSVFCTFSYRENSPPFVLTGPRRFMAANSVSNTSVFVCLWWPSTKRVGWIISKKITYACHNNIYAFRKSRDTLVPSGVWTVHTLSGEVVVRSSRNVNEIFLNHIEDDKRNESSDDKIGRYLFARFTRSFGR